VNVQCPAAFVLLRDAGHDQVAVEDPQQAGRHGEQRCVAWQMQRDRLARGPGRLLQPTELAGQPVSQVVGQVVPQDQFAALLVLLFAGVEADERGRLVQVQVRDRQGGQLRLPQPAQEQRLVDQGTFASQQFQTLLNLRSDLGVPLALALALANRQCVEQRPLPCHVEQPGKLVLRHRPADASPVGFHVRHGHPLERIGGQAAVLDGPVAEGDHRPPVDVACLGSHPFPGVGCEPPLQRLTLKVGKAGEVALPAQPPQVAARVAAVNLRNAPGLQGPIVSLEVVLDGGGQVPAHLLLRGRQDPGLDPLRLAFPAGQHLAGRTLVAAFRRAFDDHAVVVAEAAVPGVGLAGDAVAALLPRGQGGGACPLAAVLPAGETPALLLEHLGPGRQRLGVALLEQTAHVSPRFSDNQQPTPALLHDPTRRARLAAGRPPRPHADAAKV
jgi:hypothetical protein